MTPAKTKRQLTVRWCWRWSCALTGTTGRPAVSPVRLPDPEPWAQASHPKPLLPKVKWHSSWCYTKPAARNDSHLWGQRSSCGHVPLTLLTPEPAPEHESVFFTSIIIVIQNDHCPSGKFSHQISSCSEASATSPWQCEHTLSKGPTVLSAHWFTLQHHPRRNPFMLSSRCF